MRHLSYTHSSENNLQFVQVARSIRSFSGWGGEDGHIYRQIVGDNLKGEMGLFLFPHPSGGEGA